MSRRREKRRTSASALLGEQVESAGPSELCAWETDLSIETLPHLADHRLQGMIVLPGSAYVEMALAAATAAFGETPQVLEEIAFHRLFFLPESGQRTIKVVLSPGENGETYFNALSRPKDAGQAAGFRTSHASIKIPHRRRGSDLPVLDGTRPEEIRARCSEQMTGEDLYAGLRERGNQYGPAFQSIERLWRGSGESIATIRVPDSLREELAEYHLHPVFLDAAAQVLAATNSNPERACVLVSCDQIRRYRSPGLNCWVHARLFADTPEAHTDHLSGIARLLD